MRVEGTLPEEPERILVLDLVVAPTGPTARSGAVNGGSSGAVTVQGGATFTGALYEGPEGPDGSGRQVTGVLFVVATYIKDPSESGLQTPFGKGTYTISLPVGTIDILANAERAVNLAAVGGVGFVNVGANQLQITGGTGQFEGFSGVAVVNSGAGVVDEGLFLDGVNYLSLYRDTEYFGSAVAVATGLDPSTGANLAFEGSGTSTSTYSQKHADVLAGEEAQRAAATALNVGLALLGQTR